MNGEVIQLTGVNELEPVDQDMANKLITEYYRKIKRELKNITSLSIHIKKYKSEGRRTKFSVHIKVEAPTKIIASTKAVDWDLSRVLHKALKHIEREIIHRMHTNTSWKKPYE